MATVAPPSITALPAAPDPVNRATFNTLAYPWSAALPTFRTELSALGTNVKANADDAATSASTATTQAGNAATSASTATTQASTATTQAGIATTQASNASASAASAAAIAGAFVGTSTTSLLIAIASKTFTTQTGEQYTAGVWMTAVSAANSANWMFGQVTSYSGTTLVLDVQVIGGSGTFADWNLSLTGARGAQGPVGTFGGIATSTAEFLTGANIASAGTVNLDTATGNRVHITGTTTITAVTLTRGPRTVVFDGILTLTHHTTNNNLPGAANITTAAGDRAIYESDGTTVYCVSYIKANGAAVALGSFTLAQLNNAVSDGDVVSLAGSETLTNKTLTNPAYSGATANGGTVTTIDINGGTVDGAAIGGATAAAGTFTDLTATGSLSLQTGGTVTQLTSRVTSVTLNKQTGRITLFSAAAVTSVRIFSVANTTVNAASTVLVNITDSGNNHVAHAINIGSGSFDIAHWSLGGVAVSAPTIMFTVINGATT